MTSAPTRLELRGATVIDGTGGPPAPRTIVAIGDRFAQPDQAAPEATTVLDVGGLTILPGLIDAHTHLGAALPFSVLRHAGSVSAAELAAQIFRNCELALDAGFTTCRELGGVDGGVVASIAAGLVRGPRIFPSGPAIAQDGGHVTFMPPFSDHLGSESLPGLYQFTMVANGEDEVRLAARRAFRRGATQLKVMATGGIVSLTDSLDDTQLTIGEIRAAVAEAYARKTYVTVHAHNKVGVRNAILAGVKCVEHGSFLDEETVDQMADASVALVPTLTVVHVMGQEWERWGLPAEVVPRLQGVEAGMRSAMKMARKARVAVGFGTDLLGAAQNQRGLEFALRAETESAMDTILSATSVNAAIMGLGDRLGTIEPGKTADLVALAGDPISHPEILADPDNIVLVIKDGRIVKSLLEPARRTAVRRRQRVRHT